MTVNRFSSFRFGNGKVAKNRVVVPPMASQTADTTGFVTDRTIEHYGLLCRSGAGLVIAEYSFVHQSGKGEGTQLGAHSDGVIPGLERIASVIQKSGALAGIQLVHVGSKSSHDLTGAALMAPSAVSVPVRGRTSEIPVAMTEGQIEEWVGWFGDAAARAAKAKFDLVELHASHGYGLNQWLSPITNKRNDAYGGAIDARSRLLLRIAAAVKRDHPELLLSVRLPAQERIAGGLTEEEMGWVVSKLEELGADVIDVSSGIGGWGRPEGHLEQGYHVSDAAHLKVHTTLPVIGVGGIETGGFIDTILSSGQVDFAAVGRAILKNPEEWNRHNLCVG